MTDVDGRFSLLVENENATIQISYIGYVDQLIDITGRNTLMSYCKRIHKRWMSGRLDTVLFGNRMLPVQFDS